MTTLFILACLGALLAAFPGKKSMPNGFKLIGKREGMHDVLCRDGTTVRLSDAQLDLLREKGSLPESATPPAEKTSSATFDQQQYSRALAQANDKIDLLEAKVDSAVEAIQALAARMASMEAAADRRGGDSPPMEKKVDNSGDTAEDKEKAEQAAGGETESAPKKKAKGDAE